MGGAILKIQYMEKWQEVPFEREPLWISWAGSINSWENARKRNQAYVWWEAGRVTAYMGMSRRYPHYPQGLLILRIHIYLYIYLESIKWIL